MSSSLPCRCFEGGEARRVCPGEHDLTWERLGGGGEG